MRYVILTTPTDSRCEVLKKIVEMQGLQDRVAFIDFRDEQASVILNNILPGSIIDTETGKEVTLKEFFKLVN